MTRPGWTECRQCGAAYRNQQAAIDCCSDDDNDDDDPDVSPELLCDGKGVVLDVGELRDADVECANCGDSVRSRWIYNGECPGCRHGRWSG